MPDERSARRMFARLVDEATRWKGAPAVAPQTGPGRELAAWPDLEIRRAGRGVLVRVRAPWFSDWWHETWEGSPMRAVHEWLAEERDRR